MEESANKLKIYEIGPCQDSYQIGFLIGSHFSDVIKSRLNTDSIFNNQLLPFAQTPQSQSLLQSLTVNNATRYPHYWNEMQGIAHGSSVPFLHVRNL